jgi:50S ribosomal protein L16 3-hydroxylase
MNARTFFEDAAPKALAAAPQRFQLDVTYQFRVADLPGAETWTLELRDQPRCEQTASTPADCTVAIDRADFERMLQDPSCARQLFHAGRIGVSGRSELAARVPGLLRLLAKGDASDRLGALLGDITVSRFRDEYWPDRLFVSHRLLSRVDELQAIAGLASVDALLDAWPGRVRLSDKQGGRLVSPEQARTLYRDGCHLAFGDVERVFPVLSPWLEQIRWDLDLPINTFGRCHVYASPDGTGETPHFDENVNFVLQLGGEKTWRVAPNRHVKWPTARYTSAFPQAGEPLRSYTTGPLPTKMPDDAESIRLVAGSFLVVPRGYWHETRASGDSLSLNFTFDQPTWLDVLMPEIYRRLVGHEHWRELASGAGAPRPEAAASASAVAHLTPSESADPLPGSPELA